MLEAVKPRAYTPVESSPVSVEVSPPPTTAANGDAAGEEASAAKFDSPACWVFDGICLTLALLWGMSILRLLCWIRDAGGWLDGILLQVLGLAVVIVGACKDSQSYVRLKQKACTEVAIKSFNLDLPEDVSESEVIATIHELNANPDVHGLSSSLYSPLDLGLWWIILLRAYGKITRDYALQERVDV
ncbi:hypothetical protein J5N97_028472 [Dioscorea zingiberensis]|uniref:Alkaline/neutral invertase n=1 Tax=Dioscorea zingiberensis TaxID=325984 RepID=A0A9D5BZ20_9LILI|nr:hypothetical protein J5N97_028472 [Dioscorea zingiberensis]